MSKLFVPNQHLCPHCGYDLLLDAPVLIDDFSMTSVMADLWWQGHEIGLTSAERIVCYTLMKAYPSPVRRSVILERLGSDSDGKIIDVYVCRIRKKLRVYFAPDPFTLTSSRHERAIVWTP